MRTNPDLRCSRQQQPYTIMKEKVLPNQAKLNLKHQEKFRGSYYVSQPCVNRPHERRKCLNDSMLIQPKTSRNHQQQSGKAKVTKDDELVKHMSHLPGYLQCLERGENVQDKALNIGVLDWASLEKWKCNKKYTPASDGNNAKLALTNISSKVAAGSSTSTDVWNETLSRHCKQLPSPSSSSNSFSNGGISRGGKQAIQNVKRSQNFETALKSGMDRQNRVELSYKSFGKNNSEVILKKGKTKGLNQKINPKVGDCSTNSRCDVNLTKPKESATACDSEAQVRAQEVQESDIKRKALDLKDSLSSRISSAKPKVSHHLYSPKENEDVANGKSKKRMEKLQASAIDLSSQDQPGNKEKIIPLLPRALSRNCSLEKSGKSFTANLIEADQINFTDCCSEDVHTLELHPEIPSSCSLPSSVETTMEPGLMTHPLSKTQCVDLSSDVSKASVGLHKTPIIPQRDRLEATDVNMVETLKMLDQETAGLASGRGRHPSPNRRFSFSLGRMTRSFSFKESSSIPQLDSTYVSVKSGPVTSNDTVSLENTNRERASSHSRGRSSPLRRILDPILKSKSLNTLHFAETDWSSKASSSSFRLKTPSTMELLQNEKNDESSVQAFLRHNTRNGLPFFRFVANNKASIFAAPMKHLTSPGKKDLGSHYTFYTIDEFKKKNGSWINHGNKEKSCGLVYNVVGQMKVHSSSLVDSTEQNSISQYTVNEFILLGVELRHADQPSKVFMPTRELAAAIVKTPSEIQSLGTRHGGKDVNFMEKAFSECLPENERSCNLGTSKCNHNVTIVLPDGIHGLPNRGVPSPLVQRWMSGGSCDCGGWDVGCKLQVLCNEKRCHKISETSEGHSISDYFELFVQGGGAQEDKPVFSVVPIKNRLYKVQFSPSLSSLQAFFICVTVLSCIKSSDRAEEDGLYDKMVLQDPRGANDGIGKTKTVVPDEAPVKYTPSPPLSPVGRV